MGAGLRLPIARRQLASRRMAELHHRFPTAFCKMSFCLGNTLIRPPLARNACTASRRASAVMGGGFRFMHLRAVLHRLLARRVLSGPCRRECGKVIAPKY